YDMARLHDHWRSTPSRRSGWHAALRAKRESLGVLFQRLRRAAAMGAEYENSGASAGDPGPRRHRCRRANALHWMDLRSVGVCLVAGRNPLGVHLASTREAAVRTRAGPE